MGLTDNLPNGIDSEGLAVIIALTVTNMVNIRILDTVRCTVKSNLWSNYNENVWVRISLNISINPNEPPINIWEKCPNPKSQQNLPAPLHEV